MNLKNLLLTGLIAATCLGASAIPAKRGLRTLRQADGSELTLQLVGDEHFHTYVTPDGLAVSRGADGNFYYRTAQGISSMRVHAEAVRDAAEKAFIEANAPEMSVNAVAEKAQARKAPRRVKMNASQVPSSGSPKVPVILVQYKDYKFKDSDPNATFTGFFSSGAKSAYQYFCDQSNGKYTPEFDVYGPYTLSGNRTVYGGNDYYGDDKGVGKMVGEGCLGLDSKIDFSQYDNDGDGECDVVIVLYAGDGEASSYEEDCEDAVWPCQWSLSSSDYGRYLTLDGTKVDKFAVFNELNGTDLSKIDGIGTFCHEFSHCLDLPDFYDTNYGGHFGMANWSLMDYGSYNDDGYTPIGYSAYEKAFMGWIEIEEGKENTLYSLPALNQKNESTDKAVKLTNARDANEYYIIENRAKQGWDAFMPTEGLLITHVTYSKSAWEGNTVNDYDMQRMTPVPADNSLKMDKETYFGETYYTVNEDDLLGDLWPYGNATELTDESVPAAKVNTGSYLGKPVTEITRQTDGKISFWVMKGNAPSVSAPESTNHSVLSEESARFEWAPVTDTDVTYTLELKLHKDVTYELVSSTDFTDSNHGWTTEGFTETSTDGTRLGSNKQLGALTSPSFTTGDDGKVTVNFTAKSYSGDDSSVKVSLTDASDNVLKSETIALTSQNAGYSVLFTTTADTDVKVMFETPAKKQRCYIVSADIYRGDATEIAKAPARAGEGDFYRLVEGLTEPYHVAENLPAKAIIDYRVKAVPVDKENFSESAWSDTKSVNLGTTGILEVEAAESVIAEYYTLQGIKINGYPTTAGIYIEKRGNATRKLIIR